MAATVNAWAKPGAWALDTEENESELLQQHKEDSVNGHSNGGGDKADFPSLAAAVATKAKKKKPQTLSLQEFTTYGAAKPALSKGLTPDEMLVLPTCPRQWSTEELDGARHGGGFRSYGASYDRSSRVSSDEQPRRQGSFNRDSDREFAPSRADETDNWAAMKKPVVGNGLEKRERGEKGGFFSDSQSRADESDNWVRNKAFVPSESRKYEKRGGFGLESNVGGADSDNWLKKKEVEGRKIGGAFDSLRERRGGFEDAADSESWGRKREESGGRPRLNLQPRALPVDEGQKTNNVSIVKPKGNNPFGEARPREEVLKEKGQDLKEIDDKLEYVKINDVSDPSDDRPATWKRSSWSGNGRERPQESRTERAWRKPESVDSRPQRSVNLGSQNHMNFEWCCG